MIALVGDQVVSFFRIGGEIILLWLESVRQFFWSVLQGRLRVRDTLHYMYSLGVQSAPLVLFCLAVVSLMSVLEFSFHMKLVLRQDS